MKRAFITGAGGFIGRHLVSYLLQKNTEITALMMPNEAVPEMWGQQVKIVRGDIRTLSELTEEIGQFDMLFHLAAIVSDWGGKQEHIDVTVKGTEQAIQVALLNNAKFIVTTSVATFASSLGSGRLNEQSICGKPSCAYEYVKQLQEAKTLEAVNAKQLDAVIIRPANVYGVGSIWVNRFVELLQEKQPAILGEGDWDAGLVHVHNLVEALHLAAISNKTQAGDIFVISDGHGVTWNDYLESLSEALGLPRPKRIPNFLAKVLAPTLDYLGHLVGLKKPPVVTNLAYRLMGVESIYENDKAKNILNYRANFTLENAMNEIKQQYNK